MINVNSHKRSRSSNFVFWILGAAVLLACWGGVPAAAEEMKSDVPFFTNLAGEPLETSIRRMYVTGSVRIRPEYHSNETDFNSSTDDDYDFTSARFRFGIGAELASNTSLFIEAQNNSFWGQQVTYGPLDQRSADEDDIRIYQGYIEAKKISGSDFGVKIGRQELVYGTEMLLGDADFGPGLSHDAALITFARGPVAVDAWWAKEVENDRTVPINKDAEFWGVYGTWQPRKGSGVDGYWLFVNDLQLTQDERYTAGARGYLDIFDLFFFNGEFAWQYGNTGPLQQQDVRASALEASLGIRLEDIWLAPVFEIGYAFATGDNNPGDNTAKTFNPLYEDNHPRLGLTDLLTLSNIQAYMVKGSIKPHRRYELGAAFYEFRVDETEDTSAPVSFNPGAVPGGSDKLGREVDVYLNYKLTDHINGQLAWARLMPGAYVERQVTGKDDSDRIYLHLTAGF